MASKRKTKRVKALRKRQIAYLTARGFAKSGLTKLSSKTLLRKVKAELDDVTGYYHQIPKK